MEEIERVLIHGFSSIKDFSDDNLEITRTGKCSYFGKIQGEIRSWSSSSVSEGFQLQFSTLCVHLMEASKSQIDTDPSDGGYSIDICCSMDEHYRYTFYGTMADNQQEDLRDVLIDFFPLYEELPFYLDSFKEDLMMDDMDNKDNVIN